MTLQHQCINIVVCVGNHATTLMHTICSIDAHNDRQKRRIINMH